MRASGTICDSRWATFSMSCTRLWTKKIWPPRFSSRSTAWRISSGSKRVTRVSTASRSSGGVSRFEMSRTPNSDRCSVRGIGVAVIVSTSTVCRSALSRSFTSTPNRCSSSMITRPRLWNVTSGWASRCVPITMSIEPVGQARDDFARFLGRAEPRQRRRSKWETRPSGRGTCARCCSARIVVGTSTATW